MRILYLDCGMGAAGDMLTAALLELLDDPAGFVERLNALGIPGVRYQLEPAVRCGIAGSRVIVSVDGTEEGEAHSHSHGQSADTSCEYTHAHEHARTHEHVHAHDHTDSHTGPERIRHLVEEHLSLPDPVRRDVLAVYQLLAEAESQVHGVSVSEIHFHEVGTMDAVADITAVCLLMRELACDRVVVSPIHVGSGHVHCAHGILPVPAPATARILQGVPIYGGSISGELCTPTGAALLKYFADSFGPMPVLRPVSVGYGMGKKEFEQANCVRAILGETDAPTEAAVELSCNVDDMTAEAMGFALEQLLAAGALEAYSAPVGMKKSRPGTVIRVLCRPENQQEMVRLLFRHTSTLGVREAVLQRHVLSRREQIVTTPWGPVREKISQGWGVLRKKYEYEDLARIARSEGISLEQVRSRIAQLQEGSESHG